MDTDAPFSPAAIQALDWFARRILEQASYPKGQDDPTFRWLGKLPEGMEKIRDAIAAACCSVGPAVWATGHVDPHRGTLTVSVVVQRQYLGIESGIMLLADAATSDRIEYVVLSLARSAMRRATP